MTYPILKNINTHPNPGNYDDCAERALVNRLLEVFNCSVIISKLPKSICNVPRKNPKIIQIETFTENTQVPFISAGQDLPTCEVNETAQEVNAKSFLDNICRSLIKLILVKLPFQT